MPKSTEQLEERIRLARIAAWQNNLDGFTDASLKPLLKSVNQAQGEITARLEHWAGHPTPTGWSEERSMALLDELGSMTQGIQGYLTDHVAEMAGHAGSTSLDMHSDILSWGGRVPIQAIALTAAQVKSLAIDTPVGGRLLEDWVGRTFDQNMISGIKHEIMTGMLKGEGYPDLIDRISQGWDMTRTEAVTLGRTYVQSANVGAMQSVYKANQDIVKGERWCATLEIGGAKGGGTCLECSVLDGTEYVHPDKPPDCPAHHRCRCVILPMTLTWKELGLNIDEMDQVYRPWTKSEDIIDIGRAYRPPEMMGFHQGSFAQLFPKLPESDQLAIVGPGRLGLIRSGEITFSDLVDTATGRVRLLEKGPEGNWIGLRGFAKGGPEGIGGLGMGGIGEGKTLSVFRNRILTEAEKAKAEVMEIYDSGGKLLGASVGETEAVGIPPLLNKLVYDQDQNLVLHHTHPFPMPLSSGDYIANASRNGIQEMWVHDVSESSFRATFIGDRNEIVSLAKSLHADNLQILLDYAEAVGVKPSDIRNELYYIENHILGRVLEDRGLIKYSEFLSDEGKAILQKHEGLLRELEVKWRLKAEPLAKEAGVGRVEWGFVKAEQSSEKWISLLTPEEKKSIVDYTDKKYTMINEHLRLGTAITSEDKLLISNIDSALQKSILSEDLTVSRGMRNSDLVHKIMTNSAIGFEFMDSGFLSTSLSEITARGFGGSFDPVFVEIRLQKGMNAAYLKPLSGRPWENEVLLPRELKFRIIEARQIGEGMGTRTFFVKMELIKG